ncbi:unnamed protein product [Symbiodinium sp. KB8]|nr:unnamed protein product [Symbiodinium sp. KB8]
MQALVQQPALAGVLVHAGMVLLSMFSISMLRVNKFATKAAAADPTSLWSKAHRLQELTVEWSPIIALVCLALHVQATAKWGGHIDSTTALLILGVTVARLWFAFVYLTLPNRNNFSIFRMLSMVLLYTCFSGLLCSLFMYF